MPAAATGSAIRILGMFCVLVDFLDSRHAAAVFHRHAVGFENDFEARHHGEQIREIEIAQVRDAEDLPLHGALAIGDDGAEASAKFLHDHA